MRDMMLAGLEKDYKINALPKIKAEIMAFRDENADFWKERRSLWLEGEVRELSELRANMLRDYQEMFEDGKPYIQRKFRIMWLSDYEKLIKKYKGQLRALRNEGQGWGDITGDMIGRAKDYSLSEVVEINPRGFALCVAHEDQTPSMYCKGNFAHCFACGFTGDVIDVYQKISGVSFPDAVRKLQ